MRPESTPPPPTGARRRSSDAPRRLRAGALALALCGATFAGRAARGAGDPPPAELAFERFKALEGSWIGRSTAGWEEGIRVQVIAQGSAVMFTSFDAHPGETMVTIVTLDGERLRLTHYCVAGNQPRLEATEISADGRRVELGFLDGGNLPSRDHGHMDRVVYELEDDRYSSRWTWYQDGEERWMEAIESRRVPDGDAVHGRARPDREPRAAGTTSAAESARSTARAGRAG